MCVGLGFTIAMPAILTQGFKVNTNMITITCMIAVMYMVLGGAAGVGGLYAWPSLVLLK